MKLKNTLLASALLTTATLSAHAATELTPEQAAALKPYDRVVVTGRFNAIGDAVQAVSRKADKDGAASFYVVDTSDYGNGGNWRVTADLYKEAAKNVEIPGVATTAAVGSGTGVGRFFETQSSKGGRYTVTLPNGTKVEEVNKVTAAQMVPFDNIQFTGNYGNMTEISYQTAKRAAKKGAKYYHITRQWQERGGNITISADLYK
ncbi:YdgH/BhsA/McbA-like domain containing protein [Klebsiella pneumoniae]|uniref:YdgH/BhsA/McbA-like domain containing protein n=1 Tax=Klebsiella pneumoniae TaxID=573 RepID=UPI000C7D4FF4|nr:YdgH/BhsA/McbA-like domain containing protein [Klebsiella pneumoniae]